MGSGTVISEGLMDQMIRIIKEGGEIILSARHIGETVTAKEGKGNFVTAYDKKVQAFLFERLGELLPEKRRKAIRMSKMAMPLSLTLLMAL